MRDISRFQVTCVVTSCADVVEPTTSATSAAESSSLIEAVASTPIPPLLPRMLRADNRTANIDQAADLSKLVQCGPSSPPSGGRRSVNVHLDASADRKSV